MTTLHGRRVVLGVSGGIAAYKAVEVCRRLVDAGAHVAPVMTEDATRFVGAVTFSALASEPVRTSLWDEPEPIPHTRLGQTADVIVVAPATARVLGKYVAGISDDLLTATLLATRAPVIVCPAMHTEMWEHSAVQENIATLRRRGVHIVEPAVGRLAGGDVGAGRLAEPDDIVAAVERVLAPQDLKGRRVLVTAGGTREPIDPVRFIGNRSSGKQGYAVAEAAAIRGAQVTLVSTVPRPVTAAVEVVSVQTAAEMAQEVFSRSDGADLVVMAAAVADFLIFSAARPRSCWSRPPTSWPSSGSASVRARCWSASRPRQPTCGPTRRRSCRPRTSTSSWPTTCRRPASASSTTPTPWSSWVPTAASKMSP
jgi:phosphopantothenoylcysteine decarboxylase / phosphopantothenate---cysteine ligase